MAARTSSLLQLPKTLRDKIWSYAYGDLVLHAEPACPEQKIKPSGNYGFRYVVCQGMKQPTSLLQWPTCCPDGSKHASDDKRPPFFWPIVSKQFWTEATAALYASATFILDGSIDLVILASSHQQSVHRMRRLILRLGLGIQHHCRIWSRTRCTALIPHFTNLQGLTLLIGLPVHDTTNYTGVMIDTKPTRHVIRASRLEGHEWNNATNTFPDFLRSFQQHALQAPLVRAAMFDRAKRQNRFTDDVQKARMLELQASMEAVLLGRSVEELFPHREDEDRRMLEEFLREAEG